jgi:hypothetical protein
VGRRLHHRLLQNILKGLLVLEFHNLVLDLLFLYQLQRFYYFLYFLHLLRHLL